MQAHLSHSSSVMKNVIKHDPLFCTIFTDCSLANPDLVKLVAEVVDGKIDGLESVVSKSLDIGVQDNELFNSPRFGIFEIPPEDAEDRFLYYQYRIEIEPASAEVARYDYIQAIAHLMENLWNRGVKLAAACSFENELPRGGGNLYDPTRDQARKIIPMS